MTPEFQEQLKPQIQQFKDDGADIHHAFREAEKAAAKAGEEYHPEGIPLVKSIYAPPAVQPVVEAEVDAKPSKKKGK